MKRLPLFISMLAVVALSASLAYWALQLFKPAQRPISAAPVQAAPEPALDAAAGLFGGRLAAVAVSNYQLKGVVAAGNGRRSVAILSSDSKPAQAVPVGAEVAPGVRVKEVQARFVLLSEGGVLKRVELAQESGRGGENAPPLQQAQQQQQLLQQQPPQPPQPQQPLQTQPPQAPLQMAPPARVNQPAGGMQH